MAFNRKYFNLFKYLLPKADAFKIFIQKPLTKFFEGLTALPDDFRTFIENIYMDLFPNSTRSIELWEEQFGIRNPSSDMVIRKSTIDLAWKLKGGQSANYLQEKLIEAGFTELLVHENNPEADPDNFLSDVFLMTCGNSWAVCGNDDAFAGKTGGYVLANGYLPAASDVRDFLAVCGGNMWTPTYCDQTEAVCGYFEQYILEPKTYPIPNDPDIWGAIFFIGGEVTRDPVTHKITDIAKVVISVDRRQELENLILKIKPVQTWAGMIIDYA